MNGIELNDRLTGFCYLVYENVKKHFCQKKIDGE